MSENSIPPPAPYPLLQQLTACPPTQLTLQLQQLSKAGRRRLAEELRMCVNRTVRETGGHLGPNLGAVEIIIACHTVFELTQDRLIFDVGHQSYPHKLLTGRYPHFHTLRQKHGLSGYPDKRESPFDVFRSGHASTAVSTALGLATGLEVSPATSSNSGAPKTHLPTGRQVIALVGDGSMTGGMAFEGLNHAGHLQKHLIVILNDNSMSISPTVGGLSKTFNALRHVRLYEQLRDESIRQLKKIPKVGKSLEQFVRNLLREATEVLSPRQIFTTLGIDYLGPVDGNDLEKMIATLKLAKRLNRPVLIHALTKKGKGYKPTGHHGKELIGPHALSPGQRKKEEQAQHPRPASSPAAPRPSYSACFAAALLHFSKTNQRIVTITAAMEEGTGLVKYKQQYPHRHFDVGICEAHATGFAAGLSEAGLRPVFAVYSTFLQRAFDQLFHELALQQNLPVLFCVDRAGLVGDDGPSHHGLYDIAYLRLFPSFVLMAPRDGDELKAQIAFALTLKQPVAIRYPRAQVPPQSLFIPLVKRPAPLALGRFEVLQRGAQEGARLCLFAYGALVEPAAQAAMQLLEQGLKITLVNARFAKPLHKAGFKQLLKTHAHIVVLEEAVETGGLGAALLQLARELQQALPLKASQEMRALFSADKIICRGLPDRLIEHASREQQLNECGLDASAILKLAKNLLKIK